MNSALSLLTYMPVVGAQDSHSAVTPQSPVESVLRKAFFRVVWHFKSLAHSTGLFSSSPSSSSWLDFVFAQQCVGASSVRVGTSQMLQLREYSKPCLQRR